MLSKFLEGRAKSEKKVLAAVPSTGNTFIIMITTFYIRGDGLLVAVPVQFEVARHLHNKYSKTLIRVHAISIHSKSNGHTDLRMWLVRT